MQHSFCLTWPIVSPTSLHRGWDSSWLMASSILQHMFEIPCRQEITNLCRTLIREMFKCRFINFVCASLILLYIYIFPLAKSNTLLSQTMPMIFILPKKGKIKHFPPYFVYSHARDCVQVLESWFFSLGRALFVHLPHLYYPWKLASLWLPFSFLFLAIFPLIFLFLRAFAEGSISKSLIITG